MSPCRALPCCGGPATCRADSASTASMQARPMTSISSSTGKPALLGEFQHRQERLAVAHQKRGEFALGRLPLLVDRVIASSQGGSPFQGLFTRFDSESGRTAASTFNYAWDTVASSAMARMALKKMKRQRKRLVSSSWKQAELPFECHYMMRDPLNQSAVEEIAFTGTNAPHST